MQCNECKKELGVQISNQHLYACCGLTLQEYALKHHIPLDLLVNPDQVNQVDCISSYEKPIDVSNQQVQDILTGLSIANALCQEGEFTIITLGIRRLEQLLWYQNILQSIGFKYKQEYFYDNDSHRVIARNSLKIPTAFLPPRIVCNSSDSFVYQLAVLVAHIGELHSGYLFIDFPHITDAERIKLELANKHQIRLKSLFASQHDSGKLMRCETLEDTVRLLGLLSEKLKKIPNASERFFTQHEEALVSKELVFDSAHFISDHPDKCVNLHGGRYTMNVKVKDQIDPLTGFVMDYGYLKRITKDKIINHLDHHNLNYVATELSWRSSTELLSIFIWEKLIEYLPGLTELQIFETNQSHCCFVGPSLDELQKKGSSELLKYFKSDDLGKSQLRNLLNRSIQPKLKVIG
jgi:6-pyruvoyl tetrahydropterin synthase/QueD family protein